MRWSKRKQQFIKKGPTLSLEDLFVQYLNSEQNTETQLCCVCPNFYYASQYGVFPQLSWLLPKNPSGNKTIQVVFISMKFKDVGAHLLFCDFLKFMFQQNVDTFLQNKLLNYLWNISVKYGQESSVVDSNFDPTVELATQELGYTVLHSQNGPTTRLLHLTLLSDFCTRIYCDLNWSTKIISLVIKKGVNHFENIYCASLGAAYASMFRDKLDVKNAHKAKEFADRQLKIAKFTGDIPLKLRAKVYFGYYHLFLREYNKAIKIIEKQIQNARLYELEDVERLARAALFRAQMERDNVCRDNDTPAHAAKDSLM